MCASGKWVSFPAKYPGKGSQGQQVSLERREFSEVLRKVWIWEESMQEQESRVWWPCNLLLHLSPKGGILFRTHPTSSAWLSLGLPLNLHNKPWDRSFWINRRPRLLAGYSLAPLPSIQGNAGATSCPATATLLSAPDIGAIHSSSR